MAPNRKSVTALVETLSNHDLQSLQSNIQPKFLPLTHSQEQAQTPPVTPKPAVESPSYWDWPAEVEEETTDVLSLANIESNLIQAAAKYTESTTVAEHDDYWADQQEEEQQATTTKPQQVECSYWEWPAEQDSKKATIDRILAEERAYRLVSGATVEATEQAATPAPCNRVEPCKLANDGYWAWESPKVASHTSDPSHPNNNYWDWETKEPTTKADTLQALLEYEAAREMLTSDNIVRQLQVSKPMTPCATQASSDEYWTWSEGYGDQYWEAPSAPQVSTGTGYWDW